MERKFKMGVGIGGPSIIMIFVILCLATLGALSLTTANADWKLTEKAADAVTAYYSADSKAEEALASMDADLKAGNPPEADSFTFPVSKTQDLIMKIQSDGTNYTVVSRKLVPKSQWDYDQYNIEFNDVIAE